MSISTFPAHSSPKSNAATASIRLGNCPACSEPLIAVGTFTRSNEVLEADASSIDLTLGGISITHHCLNGSVPATTTRDYNPQLLA